MNRYEHGGDVFSHKGIRLDFSVNLNPYGMPKPVRAALKEVTDGCESYPDPRCRALCSALAQKHGLSPEQILCGNGADDLIYRLCFAVRPQKVLVTAPCFSEYERAATACGAEIQVHLLQKEQKFCLTESVLKEIVPGVGIVFLCSPNNPTGRLIRAELLEKILQRCEQAGALLLLDECFIEFTQAQSACGMLREHPALLILRSFTKLYAMAGLRLGYLLCSDTALLGRLALAAPCWSVSTPAQAAGLAATACAPAAALQQLIQTERGRVQETLRRMGFWVLESECSYLLFYGRADLGERLIEKGFLIRDCSNYRGLGKGYWRIGLRQPEENDLLLRAIEEVL